VKYFTVVAITSATNRVSAVNIKHICLAHITRRLMADYTLSSCTVHSTWQLMVARWVMAYA